MKTINHILAAVLLVPCAVLFSCSKGVDPVEESPAEETSPETEESLDVIFTATLAPKDGAATKVITPGTDAQDKEVLNVSWAVDEKIAIYYQKTDLSYKRGYADITAVDPVTGVATVEAHLSDPLGGKATFIYPFTLMKTDGEMNMTPFRQQNGTIDYISANLDAATTTGTIVVDGGTATVSGSIQMESQCCICKFNFTGMNADPTENYYDITITEKEGGSTVHRYIATNIAKGNLGEVYMALFGAENKDFTFSIQGNHKNAPDDQAAMAKRSYSRSMAGVTLYAKRFYRSLTINCPRTPDNPIVIRDGDSVTLEDVYIQSSEAGITCEGDATIFLDGENYISAGGGYAAIQGNGSLSILVSGSLEAHGGSGAAAIGSGLNGTCGSISIGGSITAFGGENGAAIGAGYNGACGDIIFNGGIITAYGGRYSAAIGTGSDSSCGHINIIGGKIYVYGGEFAAAIGSGLRGSCKNIDIPAGINFMHAERMNDVGDILCLGYGYNGTCTGHININGTIYYDACTFIGGGSAVLRSRIVEYDQKTGELVYEN
ncbi:MAG: hypothetical protein IK113_09590 [Bacteroidales bacterium]|nr:hypothetical protein [Bacteroidales bacterium]